MKVFNLLDAVNEKKHVNLTCSLLILVLVYTKSPGFLLFLNSAILITVIDWSNNRGDNVLRLFDILPNFSFTTSEMERDY